ncbi:hypothetical protein FISHEDRAFT_68891 [Fistulina hepatica ATCC 64428]|uniref:Uncharacterized protein n=1 Tax=Fistulina hepatica ATCC 64428 TaxID=1128425 RepID=A0A0D7ANH7_9AGAR|nr:hypothetical protein FISHEDRAFT_68891 [Fistulina hepatica ATCC 64428]
MSHSSGHHINHAAAPLNGNGISPSNHQAEVPHPLLPSSGPQSGQFLGGHNFGYGDGFMSPIGQQMGMSMYMQAPIQQQQFYSPHQPQLAMQQQLQPTPMHQQYQQQVPQSQLQPAPSSQKASPVVEASPAQISESDTETNRDLLILEKLKDFIKSGQHEIYKPVPQVETLAKAFLGPIPDQVFYVPPDQPEAPAVSQKRAQEPAQQNTKQLDPLPVKPSTTDQVSLSSNASASALSASEKGKASARPSDTGSRASKEHERDADSQLGPDCDRAAPDSQRHHEPTVYPSDRFVPRDTVPARQDDFSSRREDLLLRRDIPPTRRDDSAPPRVLGRDEPVHRDAPQLRDNSLRPDEPPRRDEVAPRRDNLAKKEYPEAYPKRDVSIRREDISHREGREGLPRRPDTYPGFGRDDLVPRRDDYVSRHDDHYSVRDDRPRPPDPRRDGPSPRRDDFIPRRDNLSARRDENLRREEYPPRREELPPRPEPPGRREDAGRPPISANGLRPLPPRAEGAPPPPRSAIQAQAQVQAAAVRSDPPGARSVYPPPSVSSSSIRSNLSVSQASRGAPPPTSVNTPSSTSARSSSDTQVVPPRPIKLEERIAPLSDRIAPAPDDHADRRPLAERINSPSMNVMTTSGKVADSSSAKTAALQTGSPVVKQESVPTQTAPVPSLERRIAPPPSSVPGASQPTAKTVSQPSRGNQDDHRPSTYPPAPPQFAPSVVRDPVSASAGARPPPPSAKLEPSPVRVRPSSYRPDVDHPHYDPGGRDVGLPRYDERDREQSLPSRDRRDDRMSVDRVRLPDDRLHYSERVPIERPLSPPSATGIARDEQQLQERIERERERERFDRERDRERGTYPPPATAPLPSYNSYRTEYPAVYERERDVRPPNGYLPPKGDYYDRRPSSYAPPADHYERPWDPRDDNGRSYNRVAGGYAPPPIDDRDRPLPYPPPPSRYASPPPRRSPVPSSRVRPRTPSPDRSYKRPRGDHYPGSASRSPRSDYYPPLASASHSTYGYDDGYAREGYPPRLASYDRPRTPPRYVTPGYSRPLDDRDRRYTPRP